MKKLNRKLLVKVKEYILAQPLRLDMVDFFYPRSVGEGGPECGMQACIGGWAVLIGKKIPMKKFKTYNPREGWHETAKKLLGLSEPEAQVMFHHWVASMGPEGAKEVADKIDAILTNRRTFKQFYERRGQ